MGAPLATAAPVTGPVTVNCGKLKAPAGKRFCAVANKANRIAFNQIKDSKFVGTRGDGEGVEDIYCANGRYESRTSGSSGTAVSRGSFWRIEGATVRQGGKWIDAFLVSGSYEIGISRRGDQWQIGVASLGRILYPGDVTKSNAAADCAAL
ncbi:MAG TPA: hypothetical protein VFX85_05525 [Solirubrobacterales bacterium]|nr:hypothetical protein [Solirubrobacterales bacterium]